MTTSADRNYIQLLINNGCAIIPIDKKKAPLGGNTWTQCNDIDYFYRAFHFNDKGFGVCQIMGVASGGREALDVDEKYYPGIGAKILSTILKIMPDVYRKLHIEKTPSGGLHIEWKVEGEHFFANQNLCARIMSLEDYEGTGKEVKNKADRERISKNGKKVFFVELKSEKSLITKYPTPGYSIIQDNPTPIIGWDERNNIVSAIQALNEVHPDTKRPKKVIIESKRYDKTPWVDYNNRFNIEEIIELTKWECIRDRQSYAEFKNPSSSNRDTHIAFYKNTRNFTVFTTNDNKLDPASYSPSQVLCQYKFGGDWVECNKYLVSNGYGELNPEFETKIVKMASKRGTPLPGNISGNAVLKYEHEIDKINRIYPYGKFWEYDDKGNVSIIIPLVKDVISGMGFRSYRGGNTVRISGQYIDKVDQRTLFDSLVEYISDTEEDYNSICHALECFLQKRGDHIINRRINLLDETLILKDDLNNCFKVFKNGVVHITKDTIKLHPFSDYSNYLFWSDKIIARNYYDNSSHSSLFNKYIDLAIEGGTSDYVKEAIGYILHDFRRQGEGWFIIFYGKEGSGKSLMSNFLSKFTTVKIAGMSTPGKEMLQSWNGESVFCMADMAEGLILSQLKEPINGTMPLKKLYKDRIEIDAIDMPKIIGHSNYIYPARDGMIDRLIPIFFTDNFNRHTNPIRDFFGGDYQTSWNEDDWNGFNNFFLTCIQSFLRRKTDLIPKSIGMNFFIETIEQEYCYEKGVMWTPELLIDFVEANLKNWCDKECFPESELHTMFKEFVFVKTNNYLNGNFMKLKQFISDYLIYKKASGLHVSVMYRMQKKVAGINTMHCCFNKLDGEF